MEPEGVPDGLGRPQFRDQESMSSAEGEHGPAVAGRRGVSALRVEETDTTVALMFLGGMGGGHLRLPAAFSPRPVLPGYQSTNPVSSSPDTPPDSVRQPHGGFSGVGAETPTWAETDSFLDQQHLGSRLWSVSNPGRSVPGPICHGADGKTSKNRRVGGRMPAWRTYRFGPVMGPGVLLGSRAAWAPARHQPVSARSQPGETDFQATKPCPGRRDSGRHHPVRWAAGRYWPLYGGGSESPASSRVGDGGTYGSVCRVRR